MSIFNSNFLPQSLVLAGSLSLYSGFAQAQTQTTPTDDVPHGRAGTATLCIEKRSYVDVNTKTIVTPVVYLNEIPAEGIKVGYVKGNAVAQAWAKILNPTEPAKIEWLKEAEDLPNQYKDATDLADKFDKNGDGTVSKDEFDAGEKGASEATKRTDLGLLMALACSSEYVMEGALNTVDVGKFPEVMTLKTNLETMKTDLSTAKTEIGNLKIAHRQAVDVSADLTKMTIALGATVGLLGVGLVFALRRKKAAPAPAPKPIQPPKLPDPAKPETQPEKIKLVKPEKPETKPNPATTDEIDMNDVLDELEAKKDKPVVTPDEPKPPTS